MGCPGAGRRRLRLRATVLGGTPTSGLPAVCLVWNERINRDLFWSGVYLGQGKAGPVVLTCRHERPRVDQGCSVALPLQSEQQRSATNTIAVRQVFVHPAADAALLVLEAAPLQIAGLRLADSADFATVRRNPAGQPLTFCGFGELDDGIGRGVKREQGGAQVRDDRPAGVGMARFDESLEFVAGGAQGGTDRDVCEGDSGAPALTGSGPGLRIIGVVSRSVREFCGNDGSIFTRVDALRDWIQGTVGIH